MFAQTIASLLICSSFVCSGPALAVGAVDADELLHAPGFEEMDPGPLKIDTGIFWAINSSYPGSAILVEDAKEAHSGKRYLAVKKTDETRGFVSILATQLYPNRGHPYLFKIWAKGGGKIMAGLVNYKDKEFLPQPEDPKARWLVLSETWQEFSATLSPDPSATGVMVFVHVTAQAELDDASLKLQGDGKHAFSPSMQKNVAAGDAFKDDFSTDEMWTNWKSDTAIGQFLLNKNEGHAGKGALEIALGAECPPNASFCFVKHFPAVSGKTYNAVVWVKAEGVEPRGEISLAFQGQNAEKQFLGTPVMATVLLGADATGEWQRRVLTFTVPKEGLWSKTGFLLCTFGIQKSSQGRAFFDDFEFGESK